MSTIQNTATHAVGIGPGFRSAGILRHGRAHRAKLRAAEAAKVTVICARIEAGLMHEDRSVRDLTFDLATWAKGRGGSFIRSMSEKVGPTVTAPFGGLRCIQVFSVRGPVTLPAKVKGWTLTRATPDEEAWARRNA